jgi:hypothetical protein
LANVAKRCAAIAEPDYRGASFAFRERLALVKYKAPNGRRVRDALQLTPPNYPAGNCVVTLDAKYIGELAKAASAAELATVDVYFANGSAPVVLELGNVGCHIIMAMATESRQRRGWRSERIDAENEAKAAAELAALNEANAERERTAAA